MKPLFYIFLLGLAGCAQTCRDVDLNVSGYTQHCLGGVIYYDFRNGAVVGYNPDGTVKKC